MVNSKTIKYFIKIYSNYLRKRTCVLLTSCLETTFKDYRIMSSIPQGAFAACKLRDLNKNESTIVRLRYGEDKGEFKNMKENKKLEYGADKYHEKLMNSIWGLYNRYSPHNIKRNEYVLSEQGYYMQQHCNAVAPNAVADGLAMAVRSGMEWGFNDKQK